MNYLMSTYKPLPITIVRGAGAYVWDDQGNRYLDATSGVAVCNLGHCHPAITQAIQRQAEQMVHASNLFTIPQQQPLAKKLAELSGLTHAFFANSGAEANEAAIKLARLYGHQQEFTQPKIVVMEGAFHGRTLATLSASGNKKIQQGFGPLVDGFIHVPFNNPAAVQQVAQTYQDIVAILVEPIQGEAGVQIPAADYLPTLRQLCDTHNWLLMVDEIQGGMGRTGKWFSYQHANIQPDVVTLAKALANGVPIGACLAGPKAAALFQPGSHGSTFGGNPLATQVAWQTLHTLEQEGILSNAEQRGTELLRLLSTALAGNSHVKDIRGKGLWIAIELTQSALPLVAQAAEHGLLINVTQENTIRLMPPLIITRAQVQQIAEIIVTVLQFF